MNELPVVIVTAERIRCAPEDLKLPTAAFKGECRYCNGVVLVPRDPKTLRLQPDGSWCCRCGQRYRVAGGLVAVEQKLHSNDAGA